MTWEHHDRVRPLTSKGERQSLLLAELLGGEPIRRIMSSPAVRCIDTVKPLSAAIAVAIDVEESLFEGGQIRLPSEPGTYIICAHGDNIPDLLTRLNIDYDACQKGSVWRVELDEGSAVVRADYLAPPEG